MVPRSIVWIASESLAKWEDERPMLCRTAMRVVVPLALVLLVGPAPGGLGPTRSMAQPQQAPASAPAQSESEKAIRAVDEAFIRDYNKGDSKAVAALFSEDAEIVEVDGERYQGRALIELVFADTFEDSKGAKIALEVDAIRFLTPEVAKEDGRSTVTPVTGAPVSRMYTVIYVKKDSRWLVSSVREDADPIARPHDRLKDLEWLIGEWVDEGSDSVVRVNCQWSEDKNFLLRSSTVKLEGKPVLTISQRIGWDPQARQVRSWEFDSEGGFGEGTWSRDGQRWVIKHTAVRAEGTSASATNTMTLERPNLVRWTSTDRVIGDDSLADDLTYVLVRVPPAPGIKAKGQATSPSSPNTQRSPR